MRAKKKAPQAGAQPMIRESMTGAERVAAAMAFEQTDRVPVVPAVVKATVAHYCGVSLRDVERDIELALSCMLRTFDDVGGWDALQPDIPDTVEMQILMWHMPLMWKVPGVDLPDDAMLQCYEKEVMTLEDYERIIEEGFERFYYEDYVYRLYPFKPGSVPWIMDRLSRFLTERCEPEWEKRGVSPFTDAGYAVYPFFMLNLMRSLPKFTEDLYFKPEMVERTLRSMLDEWIEKSLRVLKASGRKVAYLSEERAGTALYPPPCLSASGGPTRSSSSTPCGQRASSPTCTSTRTGSRTCPTGNATCPRAPTV